MNLHIDCIVISVLLIVGIGTLGVCVFRLENELEKTRDKLEFLESELDQARMIIAQRDAADRRLGIMNVSDLME